MSATRRVQAVVIREDLPPVWDHFLERPVVETVEIVKITRVDTGKWHSRARIVAITPV